MDKDFCERCERELNPDKIVWLERNCVTGEWRDDGCPPFPEGESQGWFPFGIACARRVAKKRR